MSLAPRPGAKWWAVLWGTLWRAANRHPLASCPESVASRLNKLTNSALCRAGHRHHTHNVKSYPIVSGAWSENFSSL